MLDIAGAGAAGRTFASLALVDHSTVDAGSSVLSFAGVGEVVAGTTLALDGALRFAGNLEQDAAFQALVRATRIGKGDVAASFDGHHTWVVPARAA